MLLLACDGFFSKNAFVSPEAVTMFLADPVAFCKRKDFFRGTCLEVLMEEMGESGVLQCVAVCCSVVQKCVAV